jgi:hypothetical protein
MPQNPLGFGGQQTKNRPQQPGGNPPGHQENTLDFELEGSTYKSAYLLAIKSVHSQRPRESLSVVEGVHPWLLRGTQTLSVTLKGGECTQEVHSWPSRCAPSTTKSVLLAIEGAQLIDSTTLLVIEVCTLNNQEHTLGR